jgi:hypothetical protein
LLWVASHVLGYKVLSIGGQRRVAQISIMGIRHAKYQ